MGVDPIITELVEAGLTLASYIYSTHNPGQISEGLKAAMKTFEEAQQWLSR